jgi:choline dehydrogenase
MNQYDYIIVGGGSAGCVLANRLSENPNHQVLLLEAGGEDKNTNISVPAAFSKLFKTKDEWGMHTVPQKHVNNREMFVPRGKVIGGSSSINAMIYIRGNKADYDHWASLGNKGWSYDEVLPLFKKSEGNEQINDDYHGTKGSLTVTKMNTVNKMTQLFLEAFQAEGFPHNKDFNGEHQEGFGLYQVTQRNGERCSAAKAFLHPIRNRANLTVLTKAQARKILIENHTAKGIEFEQKGQIQQAKARLEVIVSCGAYHSPHLLMLSGIGDGDELSKHGIEVIEDLKGVGKNLQDHIIAGGLYKTNYKRTLDSAERFPYIFQNLFQYLTQRKGVLGSIVAEAGGFWKTREDLDAPDVQYHFAPGYFMNHGFVKPKGNGYALGPCLLTPKSRGTVKLASSNPKDTPLIDHNYFADSEDLDTLIKGCYISEKICLSKVFQPYFKGFFKPTRKMDDENLKDFIYEFGQTLYHPTSTCKMGSDDMAVVNDKLQVHGILNLRVVDASIMPTVTRGNTNAPTIMIAEKASAMILERKLQMETAAVN